MALSLTVPTEFGVNATYHRLAAIQANWADGGCSLVLFSYLDEAARHSGAKPLGTVQLSFDGIVAHDAELTRAALYARVKSEAAWTSATDI